eukprot:CAMPEP_0113435386 /NCGR_PEP_ID=MMETSP0013_2-20120614/36245_1 /TAXON_ID=2843 ORGANISM="Skeletonema costatum, Strain 1716" /NCGR_SAMPLE_ID=MMETSP0013_2 /ASSEMBLY_ACC=CAM_ASM_000158 /LENGTH=547 /DNA_ID=CAMNT_0000325751 /DNA_START=68 /DNA_END=1708 /DNA_ORIENTATION=- /assembly_acc=CAM_ASM_000158
MGNQESVPSPVGDEEIPMDASPQVGKHSGSKLHSPQYMEGVPEPNKKSSNRSKSKDKRSSRERPERGEAREDENRDSSVEQHHNKRISPASTDSPSMSYANNFATLPPRGNKRITDDQVHLDLPMAELMAYLQMVANHSSNLPLTRRDDPDLGRTVSSLTADEYAFKCAAFIPSKIKYFGKYGKVWDLPTSEEFNAKSSTREPGISYGGACSNALLKAIYDTESEINNVASPHMVDAANLFEDDDDQTVNTAGFSIDQNSKSFDKLSFDDSNATSLTWAQLLHKMKGEMHGMGFNQVPAITSSYKFDLNKPFSLVPPEFKVGVNKKRTLLIGCNYRKTRDAQLKACHDDVTSIKVNYRKTRDAQLKACHDDVTSIKDFLVNVYGFPESPDLMTILMDDKKHKSPTHKNITEAFKRLAEQSQPGDAVFVLFTGHGCRIMDSPIDATAESYDEALLPSDYEESGIIRDTLMFKTLFAPMKKGVTVTCIMDCAHTGVMIDLPYLWTSKDSKKEEQQAKMSLNNDFSFVRFLKVVKTLYESSVFTRIGKTV